MDEHQNCYSVVTAQIQVGDMILSFYSIFVFYSIILQ